MRISSTKEALAKAIRAYPIDIEQLTSTMQAELVMENVVAHLTILHSLVEVEGDVNDALKKANDIAGKAAKKIAEE